MTKILRIADYIEHILDAIGRIAKYTDGMDFKSFCADRLVRDAVIRNFEIVGEAARNVLRADTEFLLDHPDCRLSKPSECEMFCRMAISTLGSMSSGMRDKTTCPRSRIASLLSSPG